MKLFLKFTFSILLSFNGILFAQNQADSLPQDNFEINMFVDYGKLLVLPLGFENKYEGGFLVKLNKRYSVGAEGGMAEINPLRPYRNADISAEGIYYGGFLNYHMDVDQNNSLFLGLGYTMAEFDEVVTYTIANLFLEDLQEVINRSGISATWLTLRMGSEQQLNNLIKLGGVFEVRKKLTLDELEGFVPYTIPGYGKGNNSVSPALNLYISFSLF